MKQNIGALKNNAKKELESVHSSANSDGPWGQLTLENSRLMLTKISVPLSSSYEHALSFLHRLTFR